MGILNIGNSKVDPKDMIGMEPEELKQRLDSSASKSDLDGIKQQFSSGLEELKASLASLSASIPKPVPVVEDPNDATTKLLLDPKGTIREETKTLRDAQIQTQAQLEEIKARQNPTLVKAFNQFGKEISEMANKVPLEQRAQPGFWEWMTSTIVGKKMLNGQIDRDSYPSLIGSSTVGSDPSAPEKDPNFGFDPEVASWLKNRNIPLAKAARIDQIMRKNGDPISMANYKADKVN